MDLGDLPDSKFINVVTYTGSFSFDTMIDSYERTVGAILDNDSILYPLRNKPDRIKVSDMKIDIYVGDEFIQIDDLKTMKPEITYSLSGIKAQTEPIVSIVSSKFGSTSGNITANGNKITGQLKYILGTTYGDATHKLVRPYGYYLSVAAKLSDYAEKDGNVKIGAFILTKPFKYPKHMLSCEMQLDENNSCQFDPFEELLFDGLKFNSAYLCLTVRDYDAQKNRFLGYYDLSGLEYESISENNSEILPIGDDSNCTFDSKPLTNIQENIVISNDRTITGVVHKIDKENYSIDSSGYYIVLPLQKDTPFKTITYAGLHYVQRKSALQSDIYDNEVIIDDVYISADNSTHLDVDGTAYPSVFVMLRGDSGTKEPPVSLIIYGTDENDELLA